MEHQKFNSKLVNYFQPDYDVVKCLCQNLHQTSCFEQYSLHNLVLCLVNHVNKSYFFVFLDSPCPRMFCKHCCSKQNCQQKYALCLRWRFILVLYWGYFGTFFRVKEIDHAYESLLINLIEPYFYLIIVIRLYSSWSLICILFDFLYNDWNLIQMKT